MGFLLLFFGPLRDVRGEGAGFVPGGDYWITPPGTVPPLISNYNEIQACPTGGIDAKNHYLYSSVTTPAAISAFSFSMSASGKHIFTNR
jgi:hypothetical protein